MTFSVLTLGCKVNSYESEALISNLLSHGWSLNKFDDICDVYIINTCTVTATSDQKSRQMIRSASRRNPEAIIVAMGCYVQTHPEAAATLSPIIIGTNHRLQVYDLVQSYLRTKQEIAAIENIMLTTQYEEMKVDQLTQHTRGFIKIQDGCENYCSYCAIPYARGKIRSRLPEAVLQEIRQLVHLGTKEIIIAGINTGCYGMDLGNMNLAHLIERIMKETSLYRLRLSSIELMEVSDELLNTIATYEDRIAMHLHIPLQAGSDTVLARMKRKYRTVEYENRLLTIRYRFPNIAVTTDCLAGFVGETEAEFQEAYQFIERMQFAAMHVFPYSRRAGTLADQMPGHLAKNVITDRTHQIIALASRMSKTYAESFLGSVAQVVVETKKQNKWHGRTSQYLEVTFSADENLENTVQDVRITHWEGNNLCGSLIRKE